MGEQDPQSEPVVRYERRGPVALVTMNRPEFRNAQNSKMTYALDEAFYRAAADDEVAVVVLAGAGAHFSAGHDIGSPGRDVDVPYERKASLWWSHVGQVGGASRFARESEVYVGMCRRWRELPKPTIAMVQGACVAGGLMLAWCCDMIVAADDAFFADPVVRMGIPGVEYFAHPWVMGPRAAKEFLFLGERVARRPGAAAGHGEPGGAAGELESETFAIAERIATMPQVRTGAGQEGRQPGRGSDGAARRDGLGVRAASSGPCAQRRGGRRLPGRPGRAQHA